MNGPSPHFLSIPRESCRYVKKKMCQFSEPSGILHHSCINRNRCTNRAIRSTHSKFDASAWLDVFSVMVCRLSAAATASGASTRCRESIHRARHLTGVPPEWGADSSPEPIKRGGQSAAAPQRPGGATCESFPLLTERVRHAPEGVSDPVVADAVVRRRGLLTPFPGEARVQGASGMGISWVCSPGTMV